MTNGQFLPHGEGPVVHSMAFHSAARQACACSGPSSSSIWGISLFLWTSIEGLP